MAHLDIELNNLDIGIEFWDVRKWLLCIFLHALDEHFSPISRDPGDMIFGFIDGVGNAPKFIQSSDHIPSHLDSRSISRQESRVLCG